MIRPSRAILVRADTPLYECIRLMKDANTGSVLVLGDNAESLLIGIFTERDLLKKIHLIRDGNHWSRPIRTVMTSPVISIHPSEIEHAHQILISNQIRQVPVIDPENKGEKQVIGMITMKDLFLDAWGQSDLAQIGSEIQKYKPRDQSRFKCCIISKDVFFIKLIGDFAGQVLGIKSKILKPDAGLTANLDVLFLDVDDFPPDAWPVYVKGISRNKNLKFVILAMNPRQYAQTTLSTLQLLEKTKKFWIYRKPVDTYQLFAQLQKFFTLSEQKKSRV